MCAHDSRTDEAKTRCTADAVARRSYGKLVALLAARTRDVASAEDALSEAFASPLADWPVNGCPSNPEAWLLTAARQKMIDVARRRRSGGAATRQFQLLAKEFDAAEAAAEIPDRRLALMFACTHPAIDAGIHAPLMLQTVIGLDAKIIASAFLMSPAAMGKRLVRAKNRIRQAGIPFIIPEREELPGRLETVPEAIYAGFAEGWTDPGGTDVARRGFTDEAIFLARLVAELLPEEPEALRLLALMLHAEARRRARRNGNGEYVPLANQDPALSVSARSRLAIGPCIVAARVEPTGQRWCNSTMRCRRTPARRWSQSIAHWPSRSCRASAPLSRRCKRWRPICGLPNTNPTGLRARSC